MPENHAPDAPMRIAAPTGLQLLGGDPAGICADGHCVLPSAPSHRDAADQGSVDEEPDALASGSHSG